MSSPAYKKVSPEDNFVAPMRGSTPSGTAGTAAAGVSSAAGVELVALRHRQGTDFARQHGASRLSDQVIPVVRCARRRAAGVHGPTVPPGPTHSTHQLALLSC